MSSLALSVTGVLAQQTRPPKHSSRVVVSKNTQRRSGAHGCSVTGKGTAWLSCKFIRNPLTFCILKEISPGISLEGIMLKLKLQYFGHLMWNPRVFADDARGWQCPFVVRQRERPGLPSQALAWPPRLSAGRRESGSQRPWLGQSTGVSALALFLPKKSQG